jgi:hypothetical protein
LSGAVALQNSLGDIINEEAKINSIPKEKEEIYNKKQKSFLKKRKS